MPGQEARSELSEAAVLVLEVIFLLNLGGRTPDEEELAARCAGSEKRTLELRLGVLRPALTELYRAGVIETIKDLAHPERPIRYRIVDARREEVVARYGFHVPVTLEARPRSRRSALAG